MRSTRAAGGGVPRAVLDAAIAEKTSQSPRLIERKVLTSPSGTGAPISFTSIPDTYQDLILTYSVKGASTVGAMRVSFNGDSANNYDQGHHGRTSNNVASTGGYEGGAAVGVSGFTVGAGGLVGRLEIPGYSDTTVNKAAIFEHTTLGTVTPLVLAVQGAAQWRSTAAINQIDVVGFFADGLAIGSVISLYGRN